MIWAPIIYKWPTLPHLQHEGKVSHNEMHRIVHYPVVWYYNVWDVYSNIPRAKDSQDFRRTDINQGTNHELILKYHVRPLGHASTLWVVQKLLWIYVCKQHNAQVILLVFVAKVLIVCLPHIIHCYTKVVCNKMEVRIVDYPNLLPCRLQIMSLTLVIHLIWILK